MEEDNKENPGRPKDYNCWVKENCYDFVYFYDGKKDLLKIGQIIDTGGDNVLLNLFVHLEDVLGSNTTSSSFNLHVCTMIYPSSVCV